MANAPLELMKLIAEALERGYDVTITVTPTTDGKEGRLNLPGGWAEMLGIDVAALRREQTT